MSYFSGLEKSCDIRHPEPHFAGHQARTLLVP